LDRRQAMAVRSSCPSQCKLDLLSSGACPFRVVQEPISRRVLRLHLPSPPRLTVRRAHTEADSNASGQHPRAGLRRTKPPQNSKGEGYMSAPIRTEDRPSPRMHAGERDWSLSLRPANSATTTTGPRGPHHRGQSHSAVSVCRGRSPHRMWRLAGLPRIAVSSEPSRWTAS
jgi:hypothetical protein